MREYGFRLKLASSLDKAYESDRSKRVVMTKTA